MKFALVMIMVLVYVGTPSAHASNANPTLVPVAGAHALPAKKPPTIDKNNTRSSIGSLGIITSHNCVCDTSADKPVCGTDGSSYGNTCYMSCFSDGAKVAYEGPCKEHL